MTKNDSQYPTSSLSVCNGKRGAKKITFSHREESGGSVGELKMPIYAHTDTKKINTLL